MQSIVNGWIVCWKSSWITYATKNRRTTTPLLQRHAHSEMARKNITNSDFLVYAHFAFIPMTGDNYLVSLDN